MRLLPFVGFAHSIHSVAITTYRLEECKTLTEIGNSSECCKWFYVSDLMVGFGGSCAVGSQSNVAKYHQDKR